MSKKEFTSGEIKNLTGMSYRQQHDWDSKEALSNTQKSKGSWRKYSPKEMFALVVCAEIRKQFGVGLERVKFVSDFMLQKDANHFKFAVETIQIYGFYIYLLTDFKDTFIMDTDLEIREFIELGLMRSSDDSYILLKINPIVNKLLGCLKKPVTLSTSEKIYDIIREVSGHAQNIDELQLLMTLRQEDYDRLTLHFEGGRMTLIKGDKQAKGSQEELKKFALDAVERGEFQQVQIHKGEKGVFKFVNKTKTIKPASASGQVPAKKGEK